MKRSAGAQLAQQPAVSGEAKNSKGEKENLGGEGLFRVPKGRSE